MKTQILIIGLLLLGLMTHDPVPAQSITLTNEGISEITRFFSDAVDQGSMPAIEAIVISSDDVLYHEVFGKRDQESSLDLEKGDLFDIASMTKQVTAAGVMILYDEGKLDPDVPASLYLPGLIHIPVLIIVGENDVDPPESYLEWEAAFPKATLVTLERAGHYPQIERPEEFFSAVKNFLR